MAAVLADDETRVNGQTWNKLRLAATKAGHRDGIADGRNANFQTSFDAGYRQGFTTGFALGVYKGIASSTGTEPLDEMLRKVSRGNCVVCKDRDLENSGLEDLAAVQTADTDRALAVLHSKYAQGPE